MINTLIIYQTITKQVCNMICTEAPGLNQYIKVKKNYKYNSYKLGLRSSRVWFHSSPEGIREGRWVKQYKDINKKASYREHHYVTLHYSTTLEWHREISRTTCSYIFSFTTRHWASQMSCSQDDQPEWTYASWRKHCLPQRRGAQLSLNLQAH